jgi:hypothetical protein
LPANLVAIRGNQPRQQGAPTGPAIIVTHSGNVPRGFAKRRNVWDSVNQVMNFEHSQRMESTYHVEALVPQSPATPDAMTEADVLNVARFILQNDAAMALLGAQKVYLLRVAKMDSNYIEDDSDQNENVPFFEITFQYRWSAISTTPTIYDFVVNVDRV